MLTPLSGFDARLLRTLREMIDQCILDEAMQVSSGNSKDMLDYGKRCGHINGLRDAIQLMEETAKQLLGETPDTERK